MHNEFMAFINDEDTAATVRNWADKQGFPAETVRIGGPELFSTLLESEAPPKIVLVDFDNQDQPIQIAARIVSLCGPSAHIIALGTANDVPLFRGMLAAGVCDYLVKPLTPELLTQAMLTAAQSGEQGGKGQPKEAKNIVFIGVRGGVGTSSLVTNMAWMLAHEKKKKSALLDLDLQYGTSALALDIEPGHGLRDVLSSPQRVDGLMIAGAQINESDKFSVLSAEESIDDLIHIDPSAVLALLKEMRTNYHAIFIDLPRHMIMTQKRLLATAHEIVLVTEMSLVGIRDTLRIRMAIKALGSMARITQIATRIGPNRPAAVDEATFAKGAQAKIDFIVPDDHKSMIAASNAGKMLGLVAPNVALTKTIRDILQHLAGDPKENTAAKNGPSLFGALFKRGHKEEASKS
ncbi:MAG: CpaE family protein [Bdellovibrionales bacterium]